MKGQGAVPRREDIRKKESVHLRERIGHKEGAACVMHKI